MKDRVMSQRNAAQIARSTDVDGRTVLTAELERRQPCWDDAGHCQAKPASRHAFFLLTRRERGVKFGAIDLPDANDLTVGIIAPVAQQEREAILKRTKGSAGGRPEPRCAAWQPARRSGAPAGWEAEIEAETSEDARIAGERRIRQERDGVPEAIDAYVEQIGDDDSTPSQ